MHIWGPNAQTAHVQKSHTLASSSVSALTLSERMKENLKQQQPVT